MPKTITEIARGTSELMGVSIKTGAAQPLRDAMALMDLLIAGEYEKPVPADSSRFEEMVARAEKNSEELTADAEKPETKPKSKSKAARTSNPKARRSYKSSR